MDNLRNFFLTPPTEMPSFLQHVPEAPVTARKDLATSAYYPASFALPNLISVAASDNVDQLASWSNWGTRNVSVAAPGTNLLTTQMGGGYWSVTGTSAAAPLVAGIAGLLKTFRPAANTRLIAQAISDGARQVTSLSGKVASGGVANAAGALARMRGYLNESPPFTTSLTYLSAKKRSTRAMIIPLTLVHASSRVPASIPLRLSTATPRRSRAANELRSTGRSGS